MAEEIHYKPAYELAELIRSRALSPVEVVQAHLDRIEELNPRLNAVVIFPQEDPLALAREAEAAVMRGDELGPLHGVPFTLKDCIETAGLRMTLGSKLLADNVSEQDALVYTRLRAGGRDSAGEDQHAGVRPVVGDGQPGVRADAQPVEPGAHGWRFQWW